MSVPDTVISVQNVSKKYCRKLQQAMIYGIQDTFFPGRFDSKHELRKDEYWALQNVTLEVKRGECLGVIGPNGAGKSTLLKLLNRIIAPNAGKIEIKGHICALIELGAGFHPALTGRENIYIQASILGLKRADITAKMNAIIQFAELDEFIDMPVKFYSSGMHARLGFAIAMHTHPDVILVDEVLAVGDAGFRYKSYNAMAEKMKHAAIIIVSHNMELITRLADTVVVLDKGRVQFKGDATTAVSTYLDLFTQDQDRNIKPGYKLLDFLVQADGGKMDFGTAVDLNIRISCREAHSDPLLKINISTTAGNTVAEYNNRNDGRKILLQKGVNEIRIRLSPLFLLPQKYYLSFTLIENNLEHLFWCRNIGKIEVVGKLQGHQHYQLTSQSVHLNHE